MHRSGSSDLWCFSDVSLVVLEVDNDEEGMVDTEVFRRFTARSDIVLMAAVHASHALHSGLWIDGNTLTMLKV